MNRPEPRRSYRRYVSFSVAMLSGECRYYPNPHALCRTDGCQCSCHTYAWSP